MNPRNASMPASPAPLDQPFGKHLAAAAKPYTEWGFGGAESGAEILGGLVSGWLPGDRPAESRAWLADLARGGQRFRFLFPERYYAPAVEAKRLFAGKHLGTRTHFLAKVQTHPQFLLAPERVDEPLAWLREPVLNRIAAIVWMMGAVRDVRLVHHRRAGAQARVAMFRHQHPGRLSILEVSVSAGFTQAGQPGLLERFECTGSDGFLTVHGGFDPARSFPRLILRRAAVESVQRDLPRDPEVLYEKAVANAWRDGVLHCELAAMYLDTCARFG